MSGWAVFPYQHISPLWREVQLSILCTGSPDWGSDPKQDTFGALFPARAHLRAGTASRYPTPAVPVPKATGNLSPGPAGDAQGLLGLQWWSQAPLSWPLQHPPRAECPAQPQAQPCQGHPAPFLQLEQPLALQPSKYSKASSNQKINLF